MAEAITLTTPVTTMRSAIRLREFRWNLNDRSVHIDWLDNNGEPGSAVYPTPAILNPLGTLQPSGQQLISNLNTMDLRTNSLVRRILNRLQTDGYIAAGSVSGTPD